MKENARALAGIMLHVLPLLYVFPGMLAPPHSIHPTNRPSIQPTAHPHRIVMMHAEWVGRWFREIPVRTRFNFAMAV